MIERGVYRSVGDPVVIAA